MEKKTEAADPIKSLFESIKERQPDATEREAYLLDHLIGSLGMIRRLTEKRGSLYTWDHNYQKSAYELFNEWLEENYGWHLEWEKSRPTKATRRKYAT